MKRNAMLLMWVFMATTAFAQASESPVGSLETLPKRWEGVAGDVFSRTQGSLSVDRILKVARKEKPGGYVATYDVDARISLGARDIEIKRIELTHSSTNKNVAWLTLELNDELVPRLWASVVLDESSGSYSLREMPRAQNERRFSFNALAKGGLSN